MADLQCEPEAGFARDNADSRVDVQADVQEPRADPDLAAVCEAWSALPPAVRAGIVAMVKASV
jgi:hypothetical protein